MRAGSAGKMHAMSQPPQPPDPPRRPRGVRIALHVLYWAAVVAVSLALVVALILWLESRDEGAVGALLPRLTS